MAFRNKKVLFYLAAGVILAAGLNMALRDSDSRDKWCAYKHDKDALSAQANRNTAFTPDGGPAWMEARAAWIEPRLKELQIRHFASLEAARKIQAEAAAMDCRT